MENSILFDKFVYRVLINQFDNITTASRE